MEQVHILRIVVASPGDVKEEREILQEVVRDLNGTIAKDYALYLVATGWELDAYPGFHVQGPQGQIDLALRIEECDLLIGIFWKRFGTPTRDAKSGTEHEFLKAYEAWKLNQRPQIMVYFNKEKYSLNSSEELDQLRQVLDFRAKISQHGLLGEYEGPQDFEKCIRRHLTLFMQGLSNLPRKSVQSNSSAASKVQSTSSLSVEEVVSLWLEEKGSKKKKTWDHYEDNITQYRQWLRKYGVDLNSEEEKVISSHVQKWASSSKSEKEVAVDTYNSRLSSINSFYKFACTIGWMSSNPIEKVKRQKNLRKEPLNLDMIVETLKNGLKSIDREELLGKRDYALLYLFFTTFRRPSDLVHLKCGDIQMNGNRVVVTFANSKGKEEPLSAGASYALIEYLEMVYGAERPADAPLMINYSKQNRFKKKKEPIGIQALSNVCTHYFNINPEKIRGALKALSERDGEGRRGVEKKLFGN